jgi:MoaA/NifB/PqqE/SkfB family radical SAM enzyme
MDYLQGSRIKVDFTTNGTLLERYSPEQICAWPIDDVGVSIDGVDADSYRRLRPGGDYGKVRKLVADLSEYKRARGLRRPVLKVRHVIMPGTTPEEIEAYRRDWMPFCDQITFNTFLPRGKAKAPARPRRCPDQLFFEANMRWDGRVPLCAHQFIVGKQEWLGDLKDSSLREIWASPRLAQVRTAHRQRRFDEVEFCRSCGYAQNHHQTRANQRHHNVTRNLVVNAINRLAKII